jgi:hypothetical protein
MLRNFSPWKNRRLQPWVPKASMLHPDHWSCLSVTLYHVVLSWANCHAYHPSNYAYGTRISVLPNDFNLLQFVLFHLLPHCLPLYSDSPHTIIIHPQNSSLCGLEIPTEFQKHRQPQPHNSYVFILNSDNFSGRYGWKDRQPSRKWVTHQLKCLAGVSTKSGLLNLAA